MMEALIARPLPRNLFRNVGVVFAIVGGLTSVWLRHKEEVERPRPVPILATGWVVSRVPGVRLAGIAVVAVAYDGGATRPASSVTDAAGHFTIYGRQEGFAELFAYRFNDHAWTAAPLHRVPIPARDLVIELQPGIATQVQVTDADTGLPIEGASVSAEGQADPASYVRTNTSVTDRFGIARFCLQPGGATFRVESAPRGHELVEPALEWSVLIPPDRPPPVVGPLRVKKTP